MADNIVVILCIVLIVLIILGYIAFIYNKEEEGFSSQLIANETRFLKGQESIFWKNTNKVLTTNNLE